MKLTELKIGNYIHGKYFDDEDNEQKAVCEVLAIDSVHEWSIWVDSHVNREWFDEFEGIEIDDKWLQNFEFEFETKLGVLDHWLYSLSPDTTIEIIESYGYFYPEIEAAPEMSFERPQTIALPRIKYVHQLQNLLDVLKGGEQ